MNLEDGCTIFDTYYNFNLFLYLQTTYELLFYEVYISMRIKFYFNLTLGRGLTDAQILLDHSTFTTSHAYIYISQLVPNLEDEVIP